MTSEIPDDLGFEKLPDFSPENGDRFFVRCDTNSGKFPVLESIADKLKIPPTQVFKKAMTVGLTTDVYRNNPWLGLFKDMEGFSKKLDPMDIEFKGADNDINSEPTDPNIDMPGALLLTSVTREIKYSALERDISTQELLSRCVRLGLMVFQDMVENDHEPYYFIYSSDEKVPIRQGHILYDEEINDDLARY